MKNRIFHNEGRDDRGDDENVDRVLRRFFAGEMPPEIPRATGRDETRSRTSRAAPRTAPEERHSVVPALVVGVAAVAVLVLSIWWRGEKHESAVDRKLASVDVLAPAAPEEPVPLAPVEAKRPLLSDLPFYSPVVQFTTTLPERSAAAGVVQAQWARVCLIDPDSAMQLVLELPTELRIYDQRPRSPHGNSQYSHPNLAVSFLERASLVGAADAPASPRGAVMAPRPSSEKRPYLGVFTAPPGPLSADHPFVPLGGAGGLVILAVLPESPAAAAGLRPGEILIAFDGQPLEAVAHLAALVGQCEPGQSVKLFVLGADGFRTIEAEMAGRVVATAWDTPREWELPPGKTIHGKHRLLLTASGWPALPSGKDIENSLAARGLLLSRAEGEYELRRLTAIDDGIKDIVIERGDRRDFPRHAASDHLRLRLWETADADNPPLCRLAWVNEGDMPAIEVTIAWKSDGKRLVIFAGRFAILGDPHHSLDWLIRQPLVQRVMEELPLAERRKLTESLKTVRFPAVRRRIRAVQ